MYTLSEMECMGSCVNAPMIAVADYSGPDAKSFTYNYYEDLTAEDAVSIMEDLRAGKKPRVSPFLGQLAHVVYWYAILHGTKSSVHAGFFSLCLVRFWWFGCKPVVVAGPGLQLLLGARFSHTVRADVVSRAAPYSVHVLACSAPCDRSAISPSIRSNVASYERL